MLEDARRLPSGSVLEADIIVVGAGAAGIAIGLDMIGSRTRVLILEGGDTGFDRSEQALYRGVNVGLRYEPLDLCRVKGLGGSTSSKGWAGFCKPLAPLDFEQRPWVPLSGWPLCRESLDPYYARAWELLSLPAEWDNAARATDHFSRALPLGEGDCENELCVMSPAPHLGQTAESRLRNAANVRVLFHANVSEIHVNARGDRVTGLSIATLTGGRIEARGRHVVLAAGGIENARLLLLSDSVQKGGLGNGHDLVGRCFMDHPRFTWGQIRNVAQAERLGRYDPTAALTHNRRHLDSHPIEELLGIGVTISEAAQRREQILGSRSWILPVGPSGARAGGRELREILLWVRRRRLPADLGVRARAVLADLPNAVSAITAHLRAIAGKSTHWQIQTIMEPAPNMESRVTLAGDLDRLGLRKTRLDWRLDALTERSLARTQELVIADLQRIGLDCAIVGTGGPAANQTVADPRWVWHHMGTTRMSEDPRTGVVDADCRVHGIDNLHIAGSSVFPTAGNDMPTATIVALAFRLSERLKQRLQETSAPAMLVA